MSGTGLLPREGIQSHPTLPTKFPRPPEGQVPREPASSEPEAAWDSREKKHGTRGTRPSGGEERRRGADGTARGAAEARGWLAPARQQLAEILPQLLAMLGRLLELLQQLWEKLREHAERLPQHAEDRKRLLEDLRQRSPRRPRSCA